MFFPITVQNNSSIFSGGGGGAGTFYGNGGGGGAGKISGKGGAGSLAESNGNDGSENSGGSAGIPINNSQAIGTQINAGSGGSLGSPGMGNILYSGGSAGKAVKTNNFNLEGLSKGVFMNSSIKGEIL